MAKKSKRSRNKDVLFRNTVIGTIVSIVNFIIICVVYYFLFKNPEYRSYLDTGLTIKNYVLSGNDVYILTFIIAVITPTLFFIRSILLCLIRFLSGKDDFISVLLNLGINFVANLVIILASVIIFFIYTLVLGWIFT